MRYRVRAKIGDKPWTRLVEADSELDAVAFAATVSGELLTNVAVVPAKIKGQSPMRAYKWIQKKTWIVE